MTKKTLYVSRNLANTDDIVMWAKSQGLNFMLDPSELHVTICSSKKAVEWDFPENFDNVVIPSINELNEEDEPPELFRKISMFGKDNNVLVLEFGSSELADRHDEFMEHGCSYDFDTYNPHITITYDGAEIDPDTIEPYTGFLAFGPEIYKEVNLEWADDTKEIDLNDPENLPKMALINDEPKSHALNEGSYGLPPKFWFNPRTDQIIPVTDLHANAIISHAAEMDLDEDKILDIIGDNHPVDVAFELDELAFEIDWIRGSYDLSSRSVSVANSIHLHGNKITGLRLATSFFKEMFPEKTNHIYLELNGKWHVVLDRLQQDRFVRRGVLPDTILENAAPAPRKFWLTFNLPDPDDRNYHYWEELSKGELHGVKGVSDTKNIISDFNRAAVLVMDSNKVMNSNKLERIEYNSVDYLMANNMKVLCRLFARDHDPRGIRDSIERVLMYSRKMIKDNLGNFGYLFNYYGLDHKIADKYHSMASKPAINNVDDLTDLVIKLYPIWLTEGEQCDREDLKNALIHGLNVIGVAYSTEGEWLLPDQILHVPEGSTLIIKVNRYKEYMEYLANPETYPKNRILPPEEHFKMAIALLEEFEKFPAIQRRYDVRFVDSIKMGVSVDNRMMRKRKRES